MKKIYIVSEDGYDESTPIAAFTSKSMADEFAQKEEKKIKRRVYSKYNWCSVAEVELFE